MSEYKVTVEELMDYILSCQGNYYSDKVFTPGKYHYFVVDKKKLKEFALYTEGGKDE